MKFLATLIVLTPFVVVGVLCFTIPDFWKAFVGVVAGITGFKLYGWAVEEVSR